MPKVMPQRERGMLAVVRISIRERISQRQRVTVRATVLNGSQSSGRLSRRAVAWDECASANRRLARRGSARFLPALSGRCAPTFAHVHHTGVGCDNRTPVWVRERVGNSILSPADNAKLKTTGHRLAVQQSARFSLHQSLPARVSKI